MAQPLKFAHLEEKFLAITKEVGDLYGASGTLLHEHNYLKVKTKLFN